VWSRYAGGGCGVRHLSVQCRVAILARQVCMSIHRRLQRHQPQSADARHHSTIRFQPDGKTQGDIAWNGLVQHWDLECSR
jgi:hypothetical protein